jgi:hypothetical protein
MISKNQTKKRNQRRGETFYREKECKPEVIILRPTGENLKKEVSKGPTLVEL